MDADVSKASFTIAYHGDDRADDHTMDVELLAPALLGFGKLIREANSEFNGNKAKANILVVSDFEHKCFQINFETILTYYEQLKTFLETSDVQSAKNVLEWLGLLASVAGGPYLTYLGYLKLRRGRKVEHQRQITDQSGQGLVQVTFEGDHNHIEVHQHIYNLAENPKALKATRDAVSPIGNDGFSRIEMRDGDKVIEHIDKPGAQAILASCSVAVEVPELSDPAVQPTTAWLSVYSPVYDEKAERWRFKLGTEHVYVDISDTTIAKDALARGGALVDDTYQVRLEVTEPVDESGKKGKATYKILEVLKFIPADRPLQQLNLETNDQRLEKPVDE